MNTVPMTPTRRMEINAAIDKNIAGMMIDDEFKALLMHKIFFLFLCGQLWPEEDD